MGTVVTFGEMLLRFSPEGKRRFVQSFPGTLEAGFGGAAANVAASIALLGGSSDFVTVLPNNPIATAALSTLRGLGVATEGIVLLDEGRMGSYYVETGSNQRPSKVIYDRTGSAFATEAGRAIESGEIFDGDAAWFHFTGITPALSREASEATLLGVEAAKKRGVTVSCDLNYRSKLWRWEPGVEPKQLAQREMERILPYVDLLIANEGDAEDVLGIKAEGSDFDAGVLDVRRYPWVAKRIVERFPNIRKVAITLRESVSASHNRWGAMLYDSATDEAVYAPRRDGGYTPYEITDIVDRVGAGDSFGAGLIFGYTEGIGPFGDGSRGREERLLENDDRDQEILDFAVAASALAHTVEGDFNYAGRDEIEALAGGAMSGRVQR